MPILTKNESKPLSAPSPSRTDVPIDFPESLSTDEFKTAWKEWETYRSERRKRLTSSTIKAQIKMLSGLGTPGAVAAIRKSIEMGWTGLFKNDNGGNGHGNNGGGVQSGGRVHTRGEEYWREVEKRKTFKALSPATPG